MELGECTCLNPRAVYQIRQALLERQDYLQNEMKKINRRVDKERNQDQRRILKELFSFHQDEEEELSETLNAISKLPVCKGKMED